MKVPFEGGCLCGSIRYRCSSAPFVAYTCHCRACQRLTSSAFSTCLQVSAEAFEITRGTPVCRERSADSGNTLVSHFCVQCGTAVYAVNSARPRVSTIYAGTLDEPDSAEVNAHIWTKRRLPWVILPEDHRVFSEAGDWRSDYASDPSRLER